MHLTRRDLEPRLTITFSTNFNRIRFSNVVIKMTISALKGGGYFQRVYHRFVKNSDGLFFFRDINFTNDVLTMYPRLILLHPTILLPIISPYYKVSRNLLFLKITRKINPLKSDKTLILKIYIYTQRFVKIFQHLQREIFKKFLYNPLSLSLSLFYNPKVSLLSISKFSLNFPTTAFQLINDSQQIRSGLFFISNKSK